MCGAPCILLDVTGVLQVEIGDPNEVDEEFIYRTFHPKIDIVTKKFAKPKPPGSRGPKRLLNLNKSK